MKGRRIKLLFGASIALTFMIGGFVGLEISAGVIWNKKYNEWLEKQLHGYDRVDYERQVIVPIPDTVVTAGGHREKLKSHGKVLGLEVFQEESQHDTLSDSTTIFRINKYGFKGPEISVPKPESTFRILTIGDSCTWGPANDYYTYPRTMERELNRLTNGETKFEVVNAGVRGYNLERVLKRIDEFLVVDPDMVTIYIGWNRTIGRADPQKNMYLYYNLDLYKIYYHFIENRKNTGIQRDFNTKTFYDKHDPNLDGFRSYGFHYDIQDLDTLVRIIKEKDKNTEVMIITLAGLLDLDVEPDERALKIAFPTASTNNLYAYPLLTQRYNNELKEYARKHELVIVDLEDYARHAFIPRSKYFVDSVHLTREGYMKIGEYLAQEIMGRNNLARK